MSYEPVKVPPLWMAAPIAAGLAGSAHTWAARIVSPVLLIVVWWLMGRWRQRWERQPKVEWK